MYVFQIFDVLPHPSPSLNLYPPFPMFRNKLGTFSKGERKRNNDYERGIVQFKQKIYQTFVTIGNKTYYTCESLIT